MVIVVNGVSNPILSAFKTDTILYVTVASYEIAKDLIHDDDEWGIDNFNFSNYNKRGDTTIHADGTAEIQMVWTKPTYEELEARLSDAVNALTILGVSE